MNFIRVTSKNSLYWDDMMKIYESSFPIFEQRLIDNQIDVLENNKYNFIAVYEDKIIIGILFYWDLGEYIYIEHLAVSPEFKGKSYGSKILNKLCNEGKVIILEIDPPIDEVSIRRLNFYSRLGFLLQEFNHVHPPYRKKFKPHNLKIMSYPKSLTENEYNYFNVFLNNVVMKYSEV